MALENSSLDSVELSQLREGELNVKVMKSGKKAVIIRQGQDVKVFGELCPHMGADLSEAWYCAKEGTLQCRWHGYVFNAGDGQFIKNPNEEFMKLLRKPSPHFKPEKTPKYRLPLVPFYIQDGRVFLGRSSPPAATQDNDVEVKGGDNT